MNNVHLKDWKVHMRGKQKMNFDLKFKVIKCDKIKSTMSYENNPDRFMELSIFSFWCHFPIELFKLYLIALLIRIHLNVKKQAFHSQKNKCYVG